MGSTTELTQIAPVLRTLECVRVSVCATLHTLLSVLVYVPTAVMSADLLH